MKYKDIEANNKPIVSYLITNSIVIKPLIIKFEKENNKITEINNNKLKKLLLFNL